MQAGFFEKQIVLTPDLCGSAAALSPLAAFTIFQGIASEHAERIGVGGAAMAKRGEFWLTVHSRVDFYEPAYLMDELTAHVAGAMRGPGHPLLPQLPADEGRTDRRAGPDAVGHSRPGAEDPAL